MTHTSTEPAINHAFIALSRSFLQYVAESWPWVDTDHQQVEHQAYVLAARQRQDAADLVELLSGREWDIDFGTYPTEYTDLHFISLSVMCEWLNNGQAQIAETLDRCLKTVQEAGDAEAAGVLEAVIGRQQDLAGSLKELQQDLSAA